MVPYVACYEKNFEIMKDMLSVAQVDIPVVIRDATGARIGLGIMATTPWCCATSSQQQ